MIQNLTTLFTEYVIIISIHGTHYHSNGGYGGPFFGIHAQDDNPFAADESILEL
jgi:hypothetical protein